MTIRLSTILISLLAALNGFAQREAADSIADGGILAPDSLVTVSADSLTRRTQAMYILPYAPSLPPIYPGGNPYAVEMPALSFNPGQATLMAWHGGAVTAIGGTTVYPGLMKVDSGAFGVTQQAGRFTLSLGASATKYGYFRGVHTQYGVTGSLSYLISPRLSLTVFGNYYFGRPPVMGGGLPMSPAMTGGYNASTFGGHFDYGINEHFGVQVGAQTVQQVGTNRYRVEPIVTPYIKVGKVGIGLPVGQIVNGLVPSCKDSTQMQHQPMRRPRVPQPRLQKPGR